MDETGTIVDGPSPPDDIRQTFDLDPERYERARPGYPPVLFDELFAALPSEPQIVEVGPGTGQATRELVQRGARVTAVELGERFANRLRTVFPTVDVVHDEFESAPLPAQTFDAVVSATAYHWVRPDQQIERPRHLLRPGGRLAVIDLIQVDSPDDPDYFDRVQPIYAAFGQAKPDWNPVTHDTAEPPMAARLHADDRFDNVAVHRVRWDQTYSTTAYRDLLLTYSGTLHMPVEPRMDMVNQLTAVIDDEFDGQIVRPLVATLTIGTSR